MCISLCITSVEKQNNIIINQMFAYILLFLQGTPFHSSPTSDTFRLQSDMALVFRSHFYLPYTSFMHGKFRMKKDNLSQHAHCRR